MRFKRLKLVWQTQNMNDKQLTVLACFHLTWHCSSVHALEEALAYCAISWQVRNDERKWYKILPHKWRPLLRSSTVTLKPLTLKPRPGICVNITAIHISQLNAFVAQANLSWQSQSPISSPSPRRTTALSCHKTSPEQLKECNILPNLQTQAFTGHPDNKALQ